MTEDKNDENDFEIETTEDVVEAEPKVSSSQETDDGPGDGELEDYSKNVQSRIKKLTEKYRKEERDRAEAVRLSQQLLEENKKLKSRVQQLDSGYLTEYGNRLESQLLAAKEAYKQAYNSGNADAMADAQLKLSNLAAEQQKYDAAKVRFQQQQRVQTQPQQAPAPAPAPVAATPVQQPARPDPKAESWAKKNAWFGDDRVMTTAAFAIHQGLIEEEGFDPQSDEYYTELDKRMRREFPHKFQSQKSGGGTQVASAGSSASRSTKQGRRTVKLTPSQVAIAKKLNVPLEEYAKYVKD